MHSTARAQEADQSKHSEVSKTSEGFLQEVLAGLKKQKKTLPCKYFYDTTGSQLFDQICALEAYYPTRTELGILQKHRDAIVEAVGPRAALVEPGSGSSTKVRLFLGALQQPVAYIPVEISGDYLQGVVADLRKEFPQIPILPMVADYTHPFQLPPLPQKPRRLIAYYPGSTLGNFTPQEAISFLRRLRRLVGPTGGLLIGVDRKKEDSVLHLAYNDPEGITAAFHLNLLHRIKRELGAELTVEKFAHQAFYNSQEGRIEMHLVSLQAQEMRLGDEVITFQEGETICTEYSYKYHPEEFCKIAEKAGFGLQEMWSDDRDYFSVYLCKSTDQIG